MSQKIDTIKRIIMRSVRALISTEAFSTWLQGQSAENGDLVVLNNSFVYRDKKLIKTSKNRQYICLTVRGGKVNASKLFIAEPGELNSDFKLFSAQSGNLPKLETLDQALQMEMQRLGRLVFVLIGELQDLPATVPVNHSYVKELKFDPSARSEAGIQGVGENMSIVVNQLTDPETAWKAIRLALKQGRGNDLSRLESAFSAAFEKLQDEARLRLVLPSSGAAKTGTSFIARLRDSVYEQRKVYEDAIQEWAKGGIAADGHLREAMRVAYNFADDALKVLQLLVSVADLKGVLLWCTVREHFDVAEAFRNLPWTKSHKKPSLERYREMVGGARNRAFHNLLAFDRTIEADLGDVDVKAHRLTLLPLHSRRKTTVPFDYEDREMVEILTGLTRAREVAVPFNFWKKNAVVMESFEKLLASTEDALWALNRV